MIILSWESISTVEKNSVTQDEREDGGVKIIWIPENLSLSNSQWIHKEGMDVTKYSGGGRSTVWQ